MELLIYKNEYHQTNTINDFLDFYYFIQLSYLASDLLEKGLSPRQISDAVLKAIKIGKSSGIEIRKHFMPIFTDKNREIVNDCKLSKLAYGLVLLNADPAVTSVCEWQVKVLRTYFN